MIHAGLSGSGRWRAGLLAALALTLSACGGGSSAPGSAAPPPDPLELTRVSQTSPFTADCDTTTSLRPYQDAEVEPHLAVDPVNPAHLVGAWQQDRWRSGGAHGLVSVYSLDGGRSWSQPAALPFTLCAGHSDFPRATDPWIAISPEGTVYALALSFRGDTFQSGSSSAMLVSRSADGGSSWAAPVTLQLDGSEYFNDKGAITADPVAASYVYAVWDRLEKAGRGPTLFARSSNSGTSWDAPTVAYDPGAGNQTIGNQIVVLADGTLVLAFTELTASGSVFTAQLALRRSSDHGSTWSSRVKVADMYPIGASDPETGELVRDGSLLFDIATGPAGQLAVVWQDSRFSDGQRDGIALARSVDGGQTWSTPVQVNASPVVQAFTPSISVNQDGLIGVDYFDFRYNDANASTLITSGWLAVSSDGHSWRETRSSGPFDLKLAPDASGYFVGDYKSLRALGADFLLFLAHTNTSTSNRKDIFSSLVAASSVGGSARSVAKTAVAAGVTPAVREKVSENLRRQLPPRKSAKRLKR